MNAPQSLSGKRVVITGGSRGFGLAVAQACGAAGAAVVLGARSPGPLTRAVAELRAVGVQAEGQPCDVAQPRDLAALADFARSLGGFDVWINNAAISAPYGPSLEVDPSVFEAVVQTNILGVYHGSRLAVQQFRQQGHGKLINITGRGDQQPTPYQAAYAASKAWVRSFTRALVKEYHHLPLEILLFNPGMMDTDLLQNVDVVAGYENKLRGFETVIRMWSQPPEIPARQVVRLASQATDGRSGLEVHEMTGRMMLAGALKEGVRRLLKQPGRPIDVKIHPVPSAFPPPDVRSDPQEHPE